MMIDDMLAQLADRIERVCDHVDRLKKEADTLRRENAELKSELQRVRHDNEQMALQSADQSDTVRARLKNVLGRLEELESVAG
jgi:FtsZ-binding cell division protein ZapB